MSENKKQYQDTQIIGAKETADLLGITSRQLLDRIKKTKINPQPNIIPLPIPKNDHQNNKWFAGDVYKFLEQG